MGILRKKNGNVIVSTTILSVLIFLSAAAFKQLVLNRFKGTVTDWQKFAAMETARSAFVLLEGALSRRLWEMPPDPKTCLALTDFSVSGTTTEGIAYDVEATFNSTSGILNMISTASRGNLIVTFIKQSKIVDAGDYMAFSKGNQPSTLTGEVLTSQPSAIMAGSRRIYFEGPVIFTTGWTRADSTIQPPPNLKITPSAINLKLDPAIIIQADRMSFLGGLSYVNVGPAPPPNGPPASYLSPAYLGNPLMAWQTGNLSAYLTDSSSGAGVVYNSVTNHTGTASLNDVVKHAYPRSLLGADGPLPANAAGVDSGSFVDASGTLTINYQYGGAANFGAQLDITCYTDRLMTKECSRSSDFPKGFQAWVTNAHLSNAIVTSGAQIDFPAISWDNMEALEDDATACGVVVNSGGSTYTDCLLADYNTLKKYAATPGKNPCTTITKFDIEKLALNNYSAANYTTASLTNPFLRRVIYLKTPTQIAQTQASGLATKVLPKTVRDNMPLWIVAEQPLFLQPYQPDSTSPLNDPAGSVKMRQLYFNQDPTSVLDSLKLVILSPDRVAIESPFHVPTTYAQLLSDYPAAGGLIKPRFYINTDYKHQETDAFTYGVRHIYMSNIDLITGNTTTTFNTGFFLHGMWSSYRAMAEDYLIGACMMDKPGDTKGWDASSNAQPPYASGPNPYIPPTNSLFYQPVTHNVAVQFMPWVFYYQMFNGLGDQSILEIKGLRSVVGFDSTVPSGKRGLTQPVLNWLDWNQYADALMDLSDRRFIWSIPNDYYQLTPTPGGSSCIVSNVIRLDHGNDVIPFFVNRGNFTIIQNNPDATFTNLGAIGAQVLPTVEASN